MAKSANRMSRTVRATCVVLVRRLYVACDNIRPWYLIKKRLCLYMSVGVGVAGKKRKQSTAKLVCSTGETRSCAPRDSGVHSSQVRPLIGMEVGQGE